MKNNFVSMIFLLFALLPFGISQDSLSNDLHFEVNKVYPFVSISNEKLNEAQTLSDLHDGVNKLGHYYKSSWIREYISVEILTIHNGTTKKALSKNDTFTKEQKNNMMTAEPGTDILVKVKYIPENNLKHNEIKELDFSFTIDPVKDAAFVGGQQQLKQYLKEKAIEKIPAGSFKDYDLAAIQFTVNEDGEIVNAHVFESFYQTYDNEKVNKLLLETIRDMPCWTPAEYANGDKAKQDFVLIVGNKENCIVNLLGVRQN